MNIRGDFLNFLYLIIIILGLTIQNIVKKPYTQKNGEKGVYFFTMLVSLSATVFFALTSKSLKFDVAFLPYSFLFAVFFCLGTIFGVLSVSAGSLSLTSLFVSYSLMIPTFYGLIFLNSNTSVFFIIGIILLLASLWLVNKKSEKSPFSIKWIIYVIITFFANGMCSVVQKMEQIAFDGGYKNEFMIVALITVSLVMAVMVILKERKELNIFLKTGWNLGILCGIMNGVVNLLVMVITARMSMAIVFPLISAGGIITTYFVSKFLYKEELSRLQAAGLLVGIVSVIFLNL